MKRIFLTSGLVLCLACPAFADLTAPNVPSNLYPDGVVSGTENNQNPTTPMCQQPTLEGTSGTSTFTAIWNPKDYTITYNKGSVAVGTIQGNAPTTQTVEYGDTTQLSANEYSATGYTFGGWTPNKNLEAVDGSNPPASYGDEDTITYTYDDNDAVLTAIWNPNISGAINLDSDYYATSSDSNATATASTPSTPTPLYSVYGVNLYATQPTTANPYTGMTPVATVSVPVLSGYEFGGFYTGKAGDGTQVIDNQGTVLTAAKTQVDTSADTATWYAKWTAIGYTITYNCGSPLSGSQSTTSGPNPSSANVTMNGEYTLAANNTCSLQGYTFKGWSCPDLTAPTSANGIVETGVYAAGASGIYSTAGNVTCTAQWTPNDINLVWEIEGGSFASGESATFTNGGSGTSCSYDGAIQIPTTPTKPGYEFGGWVVENTSASQQNSNQGSNNEEPTTPTEGD